MYCFLSSIYFPSATRNNTLCAAPHLAPLLKGAGLRQGSLVSNLTILSDTCNIRIALTLSAVKTERSSATNCFGSAVTSADNPSVTVTENPVIHQKIFDLIYEALSKMLYHTVPAPLPKGRARMPAIEHPKFRS